jgi:hypothetical protein
MIHHWQGTFFQDTGVNQQDKYTIPKKDLKEMSGEMGKAREGFPSSFGRVPRDVLRYKFQASEWMNWITIFLPIFLNDQLPEKYYSELISFGRAVKLMRQWDLTNHEIDTIKRLTIQFVEHYEQEYY